MMPSSKAFGAGAVVSIINDLTREFFHDGKRFGKVALQHQKPPSHPSHHSIRIDCRLESKKVVFRPR